MNYLLTFVGLEYRGPNLPNCVIGSTEIFDRRMVNVGLFYPEIFVDDSIVTTREKHRMLELSLIHI